MDASGDGRVDEAEFTQHFDKVSVKGLPLVADPNPSPTAPLVTLALTLTLTLTLTPTLTPTLKHLETPK